MDEIEIRIRAGSVEGARHLCGKRRSGLASPACPCCGTPMFCLFSLDGKDSIIAGTALGQSRGDWDFFVCPACPIDLDGYYVRIETATVGFHFRGKKLAPFETMIQPYPVYPVELKPRPPAPPKGLETLVRVEPSGSYHRLSSHLLWGEVARDPLCPFCRGRMLQVAILDSDPRLELRATKAEPSGIALNWADGNYLAVSRCRACSALGYHAAFS